MNTFLNEYLTRKEKIDVLLREQGWIVGDRTKIITEVDTKQSDLPKTPFLQHKNRQKSMRMI